MPGHNAQHVVKHGKAAARKTAMAKSVDLALCPSLALAVLSISHLSTERLMWTKSPVMMVKQ